MAVITVPRGTTISEYEVGRIVQEIGHEFYEDNLQIRESSELGPRRVRFTLRTKDSRGKGGSVSLAGVPFGRSERRTLAVCWHGQRDVMAGMLRQWPEATIRTAWATYKGPRGFLSAYMLTSHRNIGSQMYPVNPRECCDCEANDVTEGMNVERVVAILFDGRYDEALCPECGRGADCRCELGVWPPPRTIAPRFIALSNDAQEVMFYDSLDKNEGEIRSWEAFVKGEEA